MTAAPPSPGPRTLVWLASYPKSGNTWTAALLTNIIRDAPGGADINDLVLYASAAAKQPFVDWVGVDADDLALETVESLRADVWRRVAARGPEACFIKCHDAWRHPAQTASPIPADVTRAVIYIARDPRDVCVSLASQDRRSIDDSIAWMADQGAAFSLPGSTPTAQLPQWIGTWSDHVQGWLDAPFDVHLVRYEALQEAPIETLTALCAHLGLASDRARVKRAIEHASFARLAAQEREHGFIGRVPGAPAFFRRGVAGGWRDVLTDRQVAAVVASQGPSMGLLGYA